MIEKINVESNASTIAQGTWDPRCNAVSYGRANYTSDTADGMYGDDAASQVAERADRAAAAQTQEDRRSV